MISEFLSAKWENLIIITFKTSPGNLIKFLPEGLGLDTINGEAFISIVAFEFNDTKLKGVVTLPFLKNFPEINLRYYVRKNGERGVVFIREFVPVKILASAAKLLYNEPYERIKMKNILNVDKDISVTHTFRINNNEYFINLAAENKPFLPQRNSEEHFFKEHSLGFGKNKNGKTIQYEVHHPLWEIYPVLDYSYNINFGKIYGNDFGFLDNREPYNVTFAKGSDVKVFSPSNAF